MTCTCDLVKNSDVKVPDVSFSYTFYLTSDNYKFTPREHVKMIVLVHPQGVTDTPTGK